MFKNILEVVPCLVQKCWKFKNNCLMIIDNSIRYMYKFTYYFLSLYFKQIRQNIFSSSLKQFWFSSYIQYWVYLWATVPYIDFYCRLYHCWIQIFGCYIVRYNFLANALLQTHYLILCWTTYEYTNCTVVYEYTHMDQNNNNRTIKYEHLSVGLVCFMAPFLPPTDIKALLAPTRQTPPSPPPGPTQPTHPTHPTTHHYLWVYRQVWVTHLGENFRGVGGGGGVS